MSSAETIFLHARELVDAAEQRTYLDHACGGDSALRDEVESMLAAVPGAAEFFDQPELHHPSAAHVGEVIGRYKLLEKIGEGGMGTVYMAEQTEPVRRKVALKLIKLGMDTRQVVARFEAESQALALMDHPNVAKVLDGGATEAGRPYFVMDLVQGPSVTEFCDQAQLPTGQRLNLFLEVCSAIEHAHQKGIIHRDIKPSNILVTMDGDKAVPKVIDFGIAKAIRQRLTDKTLFTQFQQFVGTPAYTSPEQAGLRALDIDTRSDVYALGVLLYELLTGSTPFDGRELIEAGLDAMRRTILEREPARPSTKLSTLQSDRLAQAARQRRAEPLELVHRIRGDLDWIVMKCLEKDRSRRYETVNTLAEDVRRHLACEPVIARPPSATYRLRKAIRRHWFAVAAGTAVMLVLLAGLATTTWQAVRAGRAEREQSRLRVQADSARAEAQAQARAARRQAYAADMNLAQRALELSKISHAMSLLDRHRPPLDGEDLRGWEWRYLWQFGKSDAAGSLTSAQGNITELAVSPDGHWIAECADRPGLVLHDLSAGDSMRLELENWAPSRCAFSPRDPLLAIAGRETNRLDHTLRFWDHHSGKTISTSPLPGFSLGLAFDAAGERLFSLCINSDLREEIVVWRAPEGRKLATWPCPLTGVGSINILKAFAITSDGRLAIHRSGPDAIRVVDTQTGAERWSVKAATEMVSAIALSPDQTMLATGGAYAETTIRLWNLASGREVGRMDGHRGWVADLEFLPDGKTLVSASADQTIRFWDVHERRQKGVLNGHREEVFRIEYLNNRKTLVSADKYGRLLLWDATTVRERRESVSLPERAIAWAFAGDGRSLLSMNEHGLVSHWHPPDFQTRTTLIETDSRPYTACFSRDGRLAAIGNTNGQVSVWDLSSRRQLREIPAHPELARVRVFSDDGRYLQTQDGEDGGGRVWELTSGRSVASWQASGFADLISPDGLKAMSFGEDGFIASREWTTGRETRGVWSEPNTIYHVGFSPDASLFTVAGEPGPLRIFETATLKEVAQVKGHFSFSAGFSPLEARFATGGMGKEALKVFDTVTRLNLVTLEGDGSLFRPTHFSPDGNLIASSTSAGAIELQSGGVVHIWSAPSWREIEAAEKPE